MKRLNSHIKISFVNPFKLVLFTTLFLAGSCNKNSEPPVVGTGQVTDVLPTSVTITGFVYSDMGSPILTRGICWDTVDNPTIKNNRTSENGDIGRFTTRISNTSP